MKKVYYNDNTVGLVNLTSEGGTPYVAGTGIDITNDVISVTGMTAESAFTAYTAATDTTIGNKADTTAMTQAISETTSGKVDTSTYTAYTAATDTAIGNKADTTAVTADIAAAVSEKVDTTTYTAYTAATDTTIGNKADTTAMTQAISEATSGKVDTTAVTQAISEATSGKVDTTTYTAYTANTDSVLAGKQTTLTAGTGISIVDNVISAEGGGSITIDPTLDSGSTNAVANSAITTALNDKQIYNSSGYFYDVMTSYQNSGGKNTDYIRFKAYKNDGSTTNVTKLYFPRINGNKLVNLVAYYTDFQLLEKSAVTSAITSSSTDAQVPSAKCVYDQVGGLKLVKLTQSEYDALSPNYDSNTLYVIVN